MKPEQTAPGRDELDFLAPALRIAATPVHPLPRITASVLIVGILIAVFWACLASVDVVAVAPGRVVAHDRSKTVQAPERAVVRSILVRDGDLVLAGQTLLLLDTTVQQADLAIADGQRLQAVEDGQRAQALLQALAIAVPETGKAPSMPGASEQAQAALQTEWRHIAARHARLVAEVQRRRSEVATAQEAVARSELALPLSRQREADILRLAGQGFVASHAGQDRTRERMELERELALQMARVQEALSGLTEAQRSGDAHLAETRQALTERLSQARLRAAAATQEVAKATQRSRLLTLRAPVSGMVQQLSTHTVGGMVTEAQALLIVVPQDADPAGPAADIELDSKDIGFAAPGQTARVKLETFPYTRHGTLAAEVEYVAADATVAEGRGAVFPGRLRLQADRIVVDGRSVPLSAGMVLTAEIHIGRRRIIEYLLSPLQRAATEGLRER